MKLAPLYKDTPLILSVEGVEKSFDGFKAINDLNFYLEEGELRTVIGVQVQANVIASHSPTMTRLNQIGKPMSDGEH